MIRPVPRAEVERAWAAHNAREARATIDSGRGRPINAETAASLMDRREITLRGRKYHVPPVPWPAAVRLMDCRHRLATLATGDATTAADAARVFAEIADLSKRLLYPAGWVRRALWRVTPNPFYRLTPGEVGALLGFTLASHWRDENLPELGSLLSGISRRTSPASSPAIPGG